MPVREVLPFIVEDGSGNSLATSYATVLEFDIYMDRIPDEFKPGYLVADEFRKQQNLIRGTQLFDIYVYFPSVDAYGYQRLTRTQALQFPRVGLVGPDGYLLNERSIPPFVKDAVCQLAYELDQTNLTVEPTRGVVSASSRTVECHFRSKLFAFSKGHFQVSACYDCAIWR